MNTEPHVHEWKRPDGLQIVIATYPEQYPYVCECGAFTHNPETGEPCSICCPEDYARRGPTILLEDGPLGGSVIARPPNREIMLRCDDPTIRIQQNVTYALSDDDPNVFEFRGYTWTYPFEPRDST